MILIKSDFKNAVVMFLGFIVMSLGVALIINSQLGLFPWGVLHQGIATVIPLTFGQVTSYLGFVVLFFSVFTGFAVHENNTIAENLSQQEIISREL